MTDSGNSESVKTILILKSNPMTLQSAEQFLRTRGWSVMSTHNLSDAIHFLFENKIDYFLICANHPQKKVKTFPKILKQYPELKLVTYTDMANTPNMAILQEMGIPYQVLPPVSGPAVERVIFRIEKDETQIKNQANKKNSLLSPENSTLRKKAQENLSKFFESESDDPPPNLENLNLLSTSNDSATMNIETFSDYEERVKKQTLGASNSKSVKKENDYPYLTDNERPQKPAGSNEEFQKGVENALLSSVKPSQAQAPIEKIELAQNCICFNIESKTFRGYLVAAMGKNRRLDDELLSAVQLKLSEVIKDTNQNINDNKPLEIKIKAVDFENWAIEKAEFLKKSIHDGNEVAMAFFPQNSLSPQLGKSDTSDMISINIDDLASDVPLSFDIYVHLPANNKYILYTPKNGMFLSTQRERLKAKGIDKMHTKKDSEEDIQKSHVENTLNKSIKDFENSSAIQKKKA